MLFKSLVLASLASLALGQSTTTASAATATSSCAAQNVLDACTSQLKGGVNECNQTDYDCLCTAWNNLLTCYNDCPNDPGVFGVQQSRDQFCMAASAYGTKTATQTATSALTSTAMTVASTSTSATHSSSATAASSTHNAAAGLRAGSGIVAIIMAGVGLLV